MKTDQLINLLTHYSPTDSRELVYRDMMLDFARTFQDCFERSLQVGHFTASAWILNGDRSKALLMHHSKLDRWVQLGGHCDGESNVLAVAVKEAQEESGLKEIEPLSDQIFDLDIHLIPARKNEPAHYHYDLRFLLGVTGSERVVQNHESRELRWVEKDPLALPTRSRSVVRMFDKWCSL